MPFHHANDHEIMMSGSSHTCSKPLCNWHSLRRSKLCAYHEPTATPAEVAELDRYVDNCPAAANRDQKDSNCDGKGDAC